jgi:hypothetical protein
MEMKLFFVQAPYAVILERSEESRGGKKQRNTSSVT